MSIPSMPAEGSTSWYTWIQGLDTAARAVDSGRLADSSLRTEFPPFWTAGETVTAGTIRIAPTGETIKRNADGTCGASYDSTEQAAWTVVSSGGGGAALPDQTGQAGKFLTTDGTAASWATPAGGGASYTDEQVQDAAAALFTSGTHVGVSFAYDDTGNKINATVAPTIAIAPAGAVFSIAQNSDGTWPARPTARTDVRIIGVRIVVGSDDPPVVTAPAVNGLYAGDVVIGA